MKVLHGNDELRSNGEISFKLRDHLHALCFAKVVHCRFPTRRKTRSCSLVSFPDGTKTIQDESSTSHSIN